jgi:hypothetical protein
MLWGPTNPVLLMVLFSRDAHTRHMSVLEKKTSISCTCKGTRCSRALVAVAELFRACVPYTLRTMYFTFIYLIYHAVPGLFSTLLPMYHYILMCVSIQQMLILASLLLPIRQIVCIHKRRRIRGLNFRGFVREREVLDICIIRLTILVKRDLLTENLCK